ncbi:hypothetical protein [Streptomyces albogriseolus]|uniref:hypothetical protein n=1 Tax=Streptomyces albogriseolus TaxID=1887 RepID=UPI0036ACFC6E
MPNGIGNPTGTPIPEPDRPAIIYGAVVLAGLSLVWSGYAITDLMHSGPFGLSVAIAGDIGWITVLWAEYRGVTLGGRTWAAVLAGWCIALGVAALLVVHGLEDGGRAQAIAGPFVVLIGKIVWAFALAAMKDPAAPTPEQQAEVHAVMRDSAHQTALSHARADAEIARIRDEARVTLVRDEADFEIGLERMSKRAELARRTPLALSAGPATEQPAASFDAVAEQAITVVGEHEQRPIAPPSSSPIPPTNNASTSPNAVREQPSIADLVREQIATTTSNATAVRNVLAIRPDANKDSVAAAVRRERRKIEMNGGYG